MIKNDFIFATRSLLRDKPNSVINLFGLSVAFASVALILMFAFRENGADAFHPEQERLFRLSNHVTRNGQTNHLATSGPPFAPALVQEFDEVEKAVRLRYADESRISTGEQTWYEKGLVYADSQFFDLFHFPLALGDPATALLRPNTVVLTPALASKYFQNADPIGQSILLDGETPLEVTGVLRDEPRRSHLDFSMLASFSTFRVPPGYPVNMESWGWGGFHTYLLLKKGTRTEDFEAKLPGFLARKIEPERAKTMDLRLQTLRACYFHSAGMYGANNNRTGNLTYLKGLGIVAVLILLVAAFNFTNTALARSVRKTREIGVRRVLGASRSGVAQLLFSESMLLAGLAGFAGMLLLLIGKNRLESLLGWELDMGLNDWLLFVPLFLSLVLLTGLAAGVLPAMLFSKNKTVEALKGVLKTGHSGATLRKWLVGAQFGVMATLITGAWVVKQQMDYLSDRNPGFDREQVVALQLVSPDFLQQYERLRAKLLQNPHVLSVSAGDVMDGDNGSVPIRQPGVEVQDAQQMDILGAYFDYFKTIGVEMTQGREFSAAFPADTTSGVILNEAAVQKLGWTDPIGKRISVGDIKINAEVVGVVKDFNYRSFHDPIRPLAIFVPETIMRYLLVRIRPGSARAAIAALQADWAATLPEFPFDLTFLDEGVQRSYERDRSFSSLIYLFSGLTVLIAALGLYGLLSILLGFRVKEIGIRKVLGASVAGITGLLAKDFIMLVLVSIVLAAPVAYYFTDKWLSDFAYRIELQWWMFALAGAVAVAIAFLTVSFQSVKAALANPVKSLRSE